MNLVRKMNREISLNKTRYILYSIVYGYVFILALSLTIYFVFFIIRVIRTTDNTPKLVLGTLFGCLMIIIFLLLSKTMLVELVSFIKLYGLKFILLKDSLIISKNGQEYCINKKDSKVLYCMMGWLIIWPSGKNNNVLLLRKGFLGGYGRELSLYFKSNMNYISAKEKKKELLKSLHVNVFNPLKYIKWSVFSINQRF